MVYIEHLHCANVALTGNTCNEILTSNNKFSFKLCAIKENIFP